MRLRMAGKHIRERDWFAVAVDFLIVFVGVFVGLQASNWNETRLAKAEGFVLVERIVNDLLAIQLEATLKVDFLQGNLDRIEDIIAMLSEEAVSASSDQLAEKLRFVVRMPGTIERSPTYIELLAGGMRRISDDEQRAAIVRHDGAILDSKEFHAIRRQAIAPHNQPLVRLMYLIEELSVLDAVELSGGELELRLALFALRDAYGAEQNQLRHILQATQDLLEKLGEGAGEIAQP